MEKQEDMTSLQKLSFLIPGVGLDGICSLARIKENRVLVYDFIFCVN